MIRAVSLDLWKTLIIDRDDDEARRDRIRAHALHESLLSYAHTDVSEETMYASLRRIDVLRRDVREMRDWTLTTTNQVRFVLTQASVYPSGDLVQNLLPAYEASIFQLMPSLVEEDAPEILARLARQYPLSMTSNTGKNPGRVLLKVFDMLHIREQFTHFVFSDEVMSLKPDQGIWDTLLRMNGLRPEEIVHVGDSYRMDYEGARNASLHAVLFGERGNAPRGTPCVASLRQLEPMIQEMNA